MLAVYAVTRAWSAVVFLLAARGQPETYWGPAQPDYATFVGLFWDGSWYRWIAEYGYPAELPVDAAGAVQQNAWAFFPAYPILVRGLMLVTGAPWVGLAPAASLALGAGAMLVLDRLVQREVEIRGARLGRSLALGTVLLVGLHPAAPVLQAAYTESLALFLVVLALWLLVQRRYGWAIPVVVALGFTRAVALPMAVVVLVHLGMRWRDVRAGREALRRGDAARLMSLAAAALAAAIAWPLAVAVATSRADGYVQVQSAWRGTFSSAPVVPWFEMASYLVGDAGWLVLVLVVAAVMGLALSRHAGAAGPEVKTWGVAYLAYLLLVAFPQSSVVRFLLLAFPLALAVAAIARVWWRTAAIAVLLAAAQLGWVLWLWQLTEPTGWPP